MNSSPKAASQRTRGGVGYLVVLDEAAGRKAGSDVPLVLDVPLIVDGLGPHVVESHSGDHCDVLARCRKLSQRTLEEPPAVEEAFIAPDDRVRAGLGLPEASCSPPGQIPPRSIFPSRLGRR